MFRSTEIENDFPNNLYILLCLLTCSTRPHFPGRLSLYTFAIFCFALGSRFEHESVCLLSIVPYF